MMLEDHLGDILRKGRAFSGVSITAAAAAAGLTEDGMTLLEKTGSLGSQTKLSSLAGRLGLHPEKLAAIAGGWMPRETNLAHRTTFRMFTTHAEGLSVNAFLVWDAASRAAALFDTGVDAQPILAAIATHQLCLRDIFITHSHWDHVEALPELRVAFPEAALHSGSLAAPVAQRLGGNDFYNCGSLRIGWRRTPGHAEDGVTYHITGWPDHIPDLAVVGDAIFAGSMGNGNGRWDIAREAVRAQILSLPGETLLCPGHGPLTTVAEELAHNPFF